jgi:hypothetical protein
MGRNLIEIKDPTLHNTISEPRTKDIFHYSVKLPSGLKVLQNIFLQGLIQNPDLTLPMDYTKQCVRSSNACPPWAQHLSWQLGTPTPSLKLVQ